MAIFAAEVTTDGRLQIKEPATWRALLARLAKRKRRGVTVVLSPERRQRTNQQNRWYWGVVVPALSEWSGYERDEMHELLGRMFLAIERALPNGAVIASRRSTADLSTEEFSEYCERVRRFAAENGLYIPGPNEPDTVTL